MIRELVVQDAPALSQLLGVQRQDYLTHFRPFDFDEATVASVLSATRRDRFWGLVESGELVGFFMLRGFDAGYQRPSYGVFVAESSAGRGLGRASLEFALEWCATHGVERVLLKVAKENIRARRIYVAAGFEFVEICQTTGQEMLEKQMTLTVSP